MDTYIQHIERINQYINNTLSSYERRLFELHLLTDAELKALYEEHLTFLGGIQRIELKQEIQAARKSHFMNKWIKYTAITVGAIVLSILAYSFLFNDKGTIHTGEGIETFISQKNIEIKPRLKYSNSAIDSVLANIRPETISYSIQGNKDTILTSKKGTLISISANTFQNKNGEIVTGKIQIELIEAFNTSDFLLHNLQTTTSDSILQSGGMFFIDATENKEPLRIRDGMSLAIETKTNRKDPKMSLFSGSIENNTIDWTPILGMNDNYLIAIPFDFLNFNRCSFECYYSESQIKDLKQEKYANSYIATREFEIRMCILSYFSCNHQSPIGDEILSIYKKNYMGNLATADSLVLKYMEHNLSEFIKPGYNKDEMHFDNTGWITSTYTTHLEYAKQKLTKPLDLKSLNITPPISKTNLLDKGYSEVQANKIINYIQVQEALIQVKKDLRETKRLASYSFSINKLGWINIDMIQNDSACKESDFLVKINAPDTLESISVSLIIPKRNVAIFSIHTIEDTYSFTKKKNGYKLLPIDEEAIIIAIGVKDNQPFLGKQKIKIPSTGKIDLTMKISSQEDILEAITDTTGN